MSWPKYLMTILKYLICLFVLAAVIVMKLPSIKFNSSMRTTSFESKDKKIENYFLIDNSIIKVNDEVHKSSMQKMTTLHEFTYLKMRPSTASFNATASNVKKKLILFWNQWFDEQWIGRFHDQDALGDSRCPSFHCEFTYDKKRLRDADAVLFIRSILPSTSDVRNQQRSTQRWIIVDVEAPTSSQYEAEGQYKFALNWTATYHSSSDIVAFYGYFTPLNYTVRSLRPNLMKYESNTMKEYLALLSSSREKISQLDDFLPSLGLPSITSRSQPVAWMSSHCATVSLRELLVEKLKHFIKIDVYGSCGKLNCGKRSPYDPECWKKTLAKKYLFYLSFENRLCDEYITEKLYNPLLYGLVPVVYGGANYSHFLPPDSYIDASQYTPEELGKLILKLQENPSLYLRYHLWRKFWKVHVGGSFCELCHKLETENETSKLVNFREFRDENERCYDPKIGIKL